MTPGTAGWSQTCDLAVRFVRGVLRFEPRALAAVTAASCVSALAESATFAALVPLMAVVGGERSSGSVTGPLARIAAAFGAGLHLEMALAIFLAAVVLRAVVGCIHAHLSARYVANHVDHVRRRVYRALSRANWLYLTTTSQSRDVHALTAVADSVGHGVVYLIALVSAGLAAIAGIATAALIAPLLTAAIVGVAIVIAMLGGKFTISAHRRGQASFDAAGRLYDRLMSRMDGIKLAKAFSIEREMEAGFEAVSADLAGASAAAEEDYARAKLFQDIAAALALALFVYLGVKVLAVPGVELAVLAAIAVRLLPLVSSVRVAGRMFVGVLPAYEELLRKETAALASAEPVADKADRIAVTSAIAVQNVSFTYPGRVGAPVLHDVSFAIPAHHAFAIIGVSGAGKSTLADVIAGLIVPDSGAILVDGVEITAASRPRWRPAVAYVPQDAPLFHDTIRANLTIGVRGVGDEEIWRVLEQFGAANFVRELEDGLASTVGQRGVLLSGGQRQRLRLASAVLQRPEVLILDEATSALSPADEQVIVTALRELLGQLTVVVIAHRQSSVDWTDTAALVVDGRLAACGPTGAVLATQARHLFPATKTLPALPRNAVIS